jgi:hypothetical protein
MSDIDISKIVENHEKRIQQLENLLVTKKEDVRKPISIKEFILTKHPSKDVQKTLAIAYFLEKYENMQFFNVTDIEEGYRKAKESIPKNISDKIYMCNSSGYMMEAKEKKNGKKAWCLTNTGEGYVENEFKGN